MNLESLRKKLIFRAWHRGTREMDIVMGRFADAHVNTMEMDELLQFEELMLENDPDLYNWLTGAEEIPARCHTDVMKKLRGFYMDKK
jgi:antitoxin CptB